MILNYLILLEVYKQLYLGSLEKLTGTDFSRLYSGVQQVFC